MLGTKPIKVWFVIKSLLTIATTPNVALAETINDPFGITFKFIDFIVSSDTNCPDKLVFIYLPSISSIRVQGVVPEKIFGLSLIGTIKSLKIYINLRCSQEHQKR